MFVYSGEFSELGPDISTDSRIFTSLIFLRLSTYLSEVVICLNIYICANQKLSQLQLEDTKAVMRSQCTNIYVTLKKIVLRFSHLFLILKYFTFPSSFFSNIWH